MLSKSSGLLSPLTSFVGCSNKSYHRRRPAPCRKKGMSSIREEPCRELSLRIFDMKSLDLAPMECAVEPLIRCSDLDDIDDDLPLARSPERSSKRFLARSSKRCSARSQERSPERSSARSPRQAAMRRALDRSSDDDSVTHSLVIVLKHPRGRRHLPNSRLLSGV